MTDALLVLNTGSSSIKFALFDTLTDVPLRRGKLEFRDGYAHLALTGSAGAVTAPAAFPLGPSGPAINTQLLNWLSEWLPPVRIYAVGHRVVHGGPHLASPIVIDASALAEIEAVSSLAPNHQPAAIATIRSSIDIWPAAAQVACFDTAFHRDMPRIAQIMPLPRELTDSGLLRYGFHGLSYTYVASRLPELAGARAEGKVIVAHLGSGASMCALNERRSIATTMGFSVLDGLMMARRSGAIDPGLLLFLLQERNFSVAQLADLLHNRCGLLGVSALSDDVRVLEASDQPQAREALDLYAYRAAQELAQMAVALGGLDVLVFTGGVGENAGGVRQRICDRIRWMGVSLDAAANSANAPCISSTASRVPVYVLATDEEFVIARSVRELVAIDPVNVEST